MAKEQKEKTKKSPLLLASFLMTIAMSLGLVAVLALVNPDVTKMLQNISIPGAGEKKVEEQYSKPIEILAEVKDADGDKRFIQAIISVSVEKAKDKEKIDKQAVKLNDLYVRHLAEKSFEELQTLEGQTKMKKELKGAIEKETGFKIYGVYFTKWISQ